MFDWITGVIARLGYLFTAVGDYLNIVTNVLVGVTALMIARRYVNCWKESRRDS